MIITKFMSLERCDPCPRSKCQLEYCVLVVTNSSRSNQRRNVKKDTWQNFSRFHSPWWQQCFMFSVWAALTGGLRHAIHHLVNCHNPDFYRNEIRVLISFMMTYWRYFSFLGFLLPIYIKEVDNLREPLFSFIFLKCYYNQSSLVPLSFIR